MPAQVKKKLLIGSRAQRLYSYFCYTTLKERSMKLDRAVEAIKLCAEKMNGMYGRVIFNEWVLLSFADGGAKMVAYSGPRKEHFQSNFASDVEELRPRLLSHQCKPGDFEFAWYGSGTGFEAFMVVGESGSI